MLNELIMEGSNSYEKAETFKYLSSLFTNEHSIHKEIKQEIYVIFQSKHLLKF